MDIKPNGGKQLKKAKVYNQEEVFSRVEIFINVFKNTEPEHKIWESDIMKVGNHSH